MAKTDPAAANTEVAAQASGGPLPVTAMLEKREFRAPVATSVGASANLEWNRIPRARNPSDFPPAMILAVSVGFSRLIHWQDLERERQPMGLGIWPVARLPVQSTF